MIPSLNLDDQNVKDIFNDMLARMKHYYNGDNLDTSYQDPGVALLELFCLLKDMQQFYLNFVGNEHKQMYIKLLGGFDGNIKQSETLVVFSLKEGNKILPKKAAVTADNICFETLDELRISSNEICELIVKRKGRFERIPTPAKEFYPFGRKIDEGNALYIGFKDCLHFNPVYRLYFKLDIERNGLSIPLGKIQIEYLCGQNEWTAVKVEDQTKCFSESGYIDFDIPSEMFPFAYMEKRLYWVRISLSENFFEIGPCITGIYINAVKMIQQDTVAESSEFNAPRFSFAKSANTAPNSLDYEIELQSKENGGYFNLNERGFGKRASGAFPIDSGTGDGDILELKWRKDKNKILGYTNGTPNQAIYIQDIDDIQKIQIGTDYDSDIKWEIWEHRKNLSESGAFDRHFYIDEDYICFGNNEKGMIPPAGRIRFIDSVIKEGRLGNIVKGALEQDLGDGLKVTNITDSTGGMNELSPDEILSEIRKKLEKPGRAVTLSDYRNLILDMPQLDIDDAQAVCSHNGIIVYVKPKSVQSLPGLNEAYIKNIRNYIEPYRLLTTRLEIRQPEYLEVSVYANIVMAYPEHDYEKQIRSALNKILPEDENANVFAGSISYASLYAILNDLPYIKYISALWFECDGCRIKSGVYHTGDGVIPYFSGLKITIR